MAHFANICSTCPLQMSIQACYYILGGPEYLYGLVVAAYDIMQVAPVRTNTHH